MFTNYRMAFGTWLKKAYNKTKDFVMNKALPVPQKVARFVGEVASPVLGTIGSAIGRPTGRVILDVGKNVSGFATDADARFDKVLSGIQPRSK